MAETKRSIPEMSVDTRFLYQRLCKAVEDETIPYGELSNLISRNVQNGARGLLNSARHAALRDEGFLFEAVRGVGLKRLGNRAIPSAVTEAVSTHIRRAARRGVRKLNCVRYDELDREKQVEYNVGLSLLSAIQSISSTSSIEKVRKIATVQNSGALPLMATLEAFKEAQP